MFVWTSSHTSGDLSSFGNRSRCEILSDIFELHENKTQYTHTLVARCSAAHTHLAMSEAQWQKAVAQMAGVQSCALEQYIPDQHAPHIRFSCFSSGDIEIDRVGEEYDFALVKRHRCERPGPHHLGDQYVVHVPFLKRVSSADEVATAQVNALRVLQSIGVGLGSGASQGTVGSTNTHSLMASESSFSLAMSKVTELIKIGVTPSLAVYMEVIRIAASEGFFKEAMAVVNGMPAAGVNPRLSTWIRLADLLARPISEEIKCRQGGLAKGASALLCNASVIQALNVSVGDRDRHIGPMSRDIDRLVTSAEAICRAGYLSGGAIDSRLLSVASDVYASLLVQIYRSQDAVVAEADLGAEAMAHAFFATAGCVVTTPKSCGVSATGSQWLASTVLAPARQLRSVLLKSRSLTASEEILYALVCLLSSFGKPDGRRGFQGFDIMHEAVAVLESVRASDSETPCLELICHLFYSHFSANIDNLLDACRGDVAQDLTSSQRGAAANCVPGLLWLRSVSAFLSSLPRNSTIHVFSPDHVSAIAAVLVPFVANSARRDESLSALAYEVLGSMVVFLAGSHFNMPATQTVLREGIFSLTLAATCPTPRLLQTVIDWNAFVKGTRDSSLLSILVGWLVSLCPSPGQVNPICPLTPSDLLHVLLAAEDSGSKAVLHEAALVSISFLDAFLSSATSLEDRRSLLYLVHALYGVVTALAPGQGGAELGQLLTRLAGAQGGVMGGLLRSSQCPANPGAPLFTLGEATSLLKSATLHVDVTVNSRGEDVVVQALAPRDSTSLALNASAPNPNAFYMMVIDSTGLDALSATNALLPPTALSMSTEVNAFASLMVRYTTAGGVLLCVPPSALTACSPHSLKMLAQWWRLRSQWVGVMPQSVVPIAAREAPAPLLASLEGRGRDSSDATLTLLTALLLKKGGCIKTAIVTSSPAAYADALQLVSEESRPSVINVVDLLAKLVKKP